MEFESAHRLIGALLDDRGDGNEQFPEIQGYRLTQRLGQGAGGVVYEGVVVASGRPVALKLLHARPGKHTERAWRELDALSQVPSPAVPHVVDYGRSEDGLYIVTELIPGHGFLDHASALDLRSRVELLARLADCVQILHEHGVIHRDLKPSNVRVTSSGAPVILDLGIASLISTDVMDTLTADGAPVGTPAYMAPEQARGERRHISTRSDVYGIGAIGFELLTGEPPFETDQTLYEQVRRVGHDEPRASRSLNPSLPRPLAAVLDKACAREPRNRYESGAALAEDLRRWTRREPVEAGPPKPWERLWRWWGHHPLATTTAASLLIAVSVLIGSVLATAWINTRATSVRLMDGGSEVQFRSASGRVLKSHYSLTAGAYHVAMVGESNAGPPDYFIVSSNLQSSAHGTLPSGLYAYRPGDLDSPAWTYVPTLPAELRGAAGTIPENDIFRVSDMIVADVLESPGVEIISLHFHDPGSPTAVAVHSPDGELLDLVWHDGRLTKVEAFPKAGLVVCAGVNSEAEWKDRGYPTLRRRIHPVVVFAFETKRRERPGIIAIESDFGDVATEWYHTLLPPESTDRLSPEDLYVRDSSGDEAVRLELSDTQKNAGSVCFFLLPTGEWRRGWESDTYQASSDVPRLESLSLGPMPPRVRHPE